MRYIALLDTDRSIDNPLMVVRVHEGREEMYVPDHGWQHCDPLCRNWFENVPITEEAALALLPNLQPTGPLEDRDPERSDLRMYAHEGYYTETFYYAIETGEHPFDDPLTVVLRWWLTGQERTYTTNLVWEHAPVEGRRIRISREAAGRFQKIQALRVCGDTTYRYYAITNPLRPDVDDPALIARTRIGENAEYHEHYDGGWEGTSAIYSLRNGFADGELTAIGPETTARLLQTWTPRAARTRYFTCRAKAAPHGELLVRAREEPGGLRVAERRGDRWYIGDMDVYLRDFEVVEITEEAAIGPKAT
jgi:hypothetical protein